MADRVEAELAPFLEPDAHGAGVEGSKGVAYLHVAVLTEQLRGEAVLRRGSLWQRPGPGESPAKPGERLRVDVDLSEPGAVAGAGAVRPEEGPSDPSAEGPGLFIMPEVPLSYPLDARCGIERLGKVNYVVWRTDEVMPEEWEEHVDEDGDLMVSITMHVGPDPLIEAELGGETVVYEPSPGEIAECEQP